MPFYFHCICPNFKKQPSVVLKDLVEPQCRAQRLIRQVEICRNPPSSYPAIEISKSTALARDTSLLREIYVLDNVASDDSNLLNWLSDLLYSEDYPNPEKSVSSSSMVI
ncbi:uncharacterized protein PITG_18757 [Phytophthora infestans T30-4]|uniref:Uncharacterized protein n=1 Tax=Phytophthora infestans (strain T30-4) TaxID=403677 RepID=D0NZ65_PHYIT|nr:uncharacterized protein PITG_18757 [Phytophthora infestans T30-4]EEY68852.1 hypothetical protein PITG_18757 [Phytophthora infestans T30-4]|eukprot:XP_002997402.1 hypothetical protein PITG_18757 [Phytophthora infestans T30-4]